jgi:hypothetical protein
VSQIVQMGWNPDSPTNALRVSLLAYLRALKLASPPIDVDDELRRWIAWLEGAEVQISTKVP